MGTKIDFSSKPMASQNNVKVNEGFLKLMGAGNKNGIEEISLDLLIPYENQPFKPYSRSKLEELTEDIKQNGVLSPIIIRPVADGKYQILAGHNRVNASKAAGLEAIPAIIKEVDDITAQLIMLNTNLNQREKLSYREKAFAYKMQMDAIKHQGKRTDLTSDPMEPKSDLNIPSVTSDPMEPKLSGIRSNKKLSIETGDSTSQIKRYIRLTYLLPNLLDMVDEGNLPFHSAVNLSYLSEKEQSEVLDYLEKNSKLSVTLEQSEFLKKQSKEEVTITKEVLEKLFYPQKDKPQKEKSFSIKIPQHLFTSGSKITLDEEKLEKIAQFIEQLCNEE